MLVGCSAALEQAAHMIRLAAPRRSTVLITGETGTGKEVAARAIHAASGRSTKPMVAVNCGAIPSNLIEAELFGHVRGAFTGAIQPRSGRFEEANGGTIFLDEVGELPLDVQAKLLRVLQEREIQRLGSSETILLDFRVIAATNCDLQDLVKKRQFRQDLYYRLNVLPLRMPALRERVPDIPVLAAHFVRTICRSEDLAEKTLSESAVDALCSYSWPGNVRQLQHAVEMAVVLSGDRSILTAADFPLPNDFAQQAVHIDLPLSLPPAVQLPVTGLNFDETVNRFERSILEQALSFSSGNKARAAELLQMKRTTLLAKLKSLDMAGADGPQSICA
ncbi:MAG TPA: sigma-54 dependent transcriptional regulator [Bryobacteraceae bacterium]|nr:sigma-54 dependent transcriptional regulator [Bryobacteraceae bacterium]